MLKKILVIRYGTIGDTIFSLPFYRELKKFYGNNCKIDVITDENTKIILKNLNLIDNFIDCRYLKFKNIFKLLKILRKYDKIYYLRKCSTLSLLAFIANIKERIGLKIKGNKFLTTPVFYNENKHVIDLYLDVLKKDNIPIENNNLDNIFKNIKNYDFKINNKYICIQAYSRSTLKDWDIKEWEKVVNYIVNKLNLSVVLLGSKKDFENYDKTFKNYKNVYNLCNECDLEKTISVIKNSELFIGIDSGLIHISAVLNKKSILIHGSTSLTHWAPKNDNCIIITKNYKCSPCCFLVTGDKKTNCEIPKCIYEIKANEVIEKINFLYKN